MPEIRKKKKNSQNGYGVGSERKPMLGEPKTSGGGINQQGGHVHG